VSIRKVARKTKGDSGQAMVEFAIVATMLLVLLLGIAQVAIAYSHYMALTDAVRAGSRQGAVSRLTSPASAAEARVRSAANGSLDSAPGGPLTVTVTFKDPGGGSQVVQGGDITVKATYPYEINLLGLVVKSGTLTSETTERVE
jgi:Flp pilus assembly protein TadG